MREGRCCGTAGSCAVIRPPGRWLTPEAWVARDVNQRQRLGIGALHSVPMGAGQAAPALHTPSQPAATSLIARASHSPCLHDHPKHTGQGSTAPTTCSEASTPSATFSCIEATVPACVEPSRSWWNSVVFPASQGPTSSTALPFGPLAHSLRRAAQSRQEAAVRAMGGGRKVPEASPPPPLPGHPLVLTQQEEHQREGRGDEQEAAALQHLRELIRRVIHRLRTCESAAAGLGSSQQRRCGRQRRAFVAPLPIG